MVNSRNKGKRGEGMLRDFLNAHGYDTRRGQQYCGANGDADVVGIDGMHIECKFTETLKPYDFVKQARDDAREDEIPVVFAKRSRRPWLVIMDANDFMELWKRCV